METLRISALLLIAGCWICACAEECSVTCLLMSEECEKGRTAGTLDECRSDLYRCSRDCAKTPPGDESSSADLSQETGLEFLAGDHGNRDLNTETADQEKTSTHGAKRGSWSKRRNPPEPDSIQGGQRHRLAKFLYQGDQNKDKLLAGDNAKLTSLPLPVVLVMSKMLRNGGLVPGLERDEWATGEGLDLQRRGSWSKRQWFRPIAVHTRGSWSKREPISVDVRGSWSKREPINVDERGSWSKREPINVDERGSWSKREPINVDVRGSWSKREPINVDERGSWSKREPINVDERGSWSKREPINIDVRGSWSKREPINIDVRGSWSKRKPMNIEERGSWSKREPINIENRGSWS